MPSWLQLMRNTAAGGLAAGSAGGSPIERLGSVGGSTVTVGGGDAGFPGGGGAGILLEQPHPEASGRMTSGVGLLGPGGDRCSEAPLPGADPGISTAPPDQVPTDLPID